MYTATRNDGFAPYPERDASPRAERRTAQGARLLAFQQVGSLHSERPLSVVNSLPAESPYRTASSGRDMLRAHPIIPHIAYASAVQSTAPDAGMGGDVIDVYDLDRRFALIVVADISGNGAAAAAQAAFIRYTMRTLAIESDGDPAAVLAKFNAIYCRTIDNYEAFVVVIVGIVDSQTGEVAYASAGHEPAFVRHAGAVRTLAPTGPIVGVSPYSAYRTERFVLQRGDVLVWTTDGFTESRDARRSLLGTDGLANWIAAGAADVGDLTAELMNALRARGGDRVNDDAGMLAVAYDGIPAPLDRLPQLDLALNAIAFETIRLPQPCGAPTR